MQLEEPSPEVVRAPRLGGIGLVQLQPGRNTAALRGRLEVVPPGNPFGVPGQERELQPPELDELRGQPLVKFPRSPSAWAAWAANSGPYFFLFVKKSSAALRLDSTGCPPLVIPSSLAVTSARNSQKEA